MDDPKFPADPSTQYQAHNPQERWESGDEKGPRIVVRPGREFVPHDALGRQRIDLNATVAQVRVGAGRMWAGGSTLPGVMFVACIGSYCSLHLFLDKVGISTGPTTGLSLLGTFLVGGAVLYSVNRWCWRLLLTPTARLALARSADPAWLALLCRAPWTRKLAALHGSNGASFDLRRWQGQLGAAAPRFVSFDVEIPTQGERMALGEPVNSMEREKPSRRMIWVVGVFGLLYLPTAWAKLAAIGLGPVLGLLVAIALVGGYVLVLLFFAARLVSSGSRPAGSSPARSRSFVQVGSEFTWRVPA